MVWTPSTKTPRNADYHPHNSTPLAAQCQQESRSVILSCHRNKLLTELTVNAPFPPFSLPPSLPCTHRQFEMNFNHENDFKLYFPPFSSARLYAGRA